MIPTIGKLNESKMVDILKYQLQTKTIGFIHGGLFFTVRKWNIYFNVKYQCLRSNANVMLKQIYKTQVREKSIEFEANSTEIQIEFSSSHIGSFLIQSLTIKSR